MEELSDRVEEADVETQTDAFLDRPPSPLFIPAKSGVDVATQILEGEVCCHTLISVITEKAANFDCLFELCDVHVMPYTG